MRQTHKQLEKEGWLRQFVADEALADDAEKVYNLLGYEVLRLPVAKPWLKKTFSFSYEKTPGSCEIVYVRPKEKTQDGERD